MAGRKAKTPQTSADAVEAPEAEIAVVRDEVVDAVVVEEAVADTIDATPEADTPKEEVVEAAPSVSRPEQAPAPVRRGGFFSMLLGGVAAAAIGFGMARYVLPDDFPFPKAGSGDLAAAVQKADDEAKSADLILAGRIEALEAGPDLSGVTGAVEAIRVASDAVASQVEVLNGRMGALEAQVAELMTRPVTEGANPAAVAAYEAELAKLQAAMADQRQELEALAGEAEANRAAAQMTEQEAMIRNSLTGIRIAVENGGSYQVELDNLAGVGVSLPALLVERAEGGVPTLAALRDTFPQAARAALAAARAAETGGGVGSVLTSLLGARSLEPRDGGDADAVLSRAEAALREGRMTDAVAEVEALPEGARVEMASWLAMATERAATLAALDELAAGLTQK